MKDLTKPNKKSNKNLVVIAPQPGPQMEFLSTPADVAIYGGAAGGGKSFALLLQPLAFVDVKGFGCTIFRKNHIQIFSEGGLWDESKTLYGKVKNAEPRKGSTSWIFKDKNGNEISKVSFAHIERDEELPNWQGSQICMIGFDELTHFSRHTFLYMLSRNRSLCGVEPFVRGTCNPDANSWVAEFISWYIDQETGYAIPERSGVIRWFLVYQDVVYWADTKRELDEQFAFIPPGPDKPIPKSFTFIMSSVYDNKELLRVNPSYISNLKSLPLIEQERLLKGNWKIKASAGLFFKRTQVGEFLQVVPDDVIRWVRCWDLAASEKTDKGDPAFTAGVLIGKRKNGRYIIADVIRRQMNSGDVRKTITHTAQQDIAKYKRVRIRVPQDPGQAGKEQANSYIKQLSGYDVVAVLESGSKESRAEPMAAQWQAGNFDILIGPWNDEYLQELENFPDWKFKDMVDASANGFNEIETKSQFNLGNLI